MTENDWDISRVLKLRKLTRAMVEHFSNSLKEYLAALAPLFAPRLLLGEYIRSDVKQTVRGAEPVFKELQALYKSVGGLKPYSFQDELKSPLDVFGASVELSASEYVYTAQTGGEQRSVTVTSPFKWVLSYKDLGPKRLRELLVSPSGSARADLQICLLHYLILHLIAARKPGVGTLLDALRFKLASEEHADFGKLPVVVISAPVATILPPDDIIIQSVELSGASAFEEVADLGQIARLSDPVREQLIDLIRKQDESLLPFAVQGS